MGIVVTTCFIAAAVGASGASGSRCPLPVLRVPPGGLEETEFETNYRRKKPVVLLNATGGWTAHSLWKDGGFVKIHGDLRLKARPEIVQSNIDVGVSNLSLREYLAAEDTSWRGHIFFDFANYNVHQALLPECQPTPWPLLRARAVPAFSVGRRGTGSGSHQHEENWIAQVVGRKAWVLAPPNTPEPPTGQRPCELLKPGALPKGFFVCKVGEGATLYLPDRWHHATCNLDAITVGVGGKGDSSKWPPHLFSVEDGDLGALREADAAGVAVLEGASGSALHHAAAAGKLSILNFLLDRRGDPLARAAQEGGTAAHWAARAGHAQVLERLLGYTEKVARLRSRDGQEPVHLAAREGHSGCAMLLLSHGVPMSAKTAGGEQLVHLAAASQALPLLQQLFRMGANFEAMDAEGQVPLHWAASHGHVDVVRFLLHEAKVRRDPRSTQPCKGCQPIHWAAGKDYVGVLDVLVAEGSHPQTRDGFGFHALHWAANSGAALATRRLMELRADPKARTDDGRRPHDIAKRQGHNEVLRLLRGYLGKRRSQKQEL